MTHRKREGDNLSPLKKKAEALLIKTLEGKDASKFSPEEVRQLVHALTVHQIELEMQNEELLRAQGKLEQLKDKYMDLYDFAPIGYVTIDDKGHILEANLTATRLLGLERKKLLKSFVSRFVCEQELANYYLYLKRLIEAKSTEACEIKLKKADGTEFFAKLESAPVENETWEPTQFRMMLSDITESKRAGEELRHAHEELKKAHDGLEDRVKKRTEELQLSNTSLERSNADLRQFAYMASHDLQEPLRNIANCIQMLEKDYRNKLGPDADQYIHYAVESAVRMKDLLLGLLSYSRVATRGKLLQPIDTEEILNRALKNLTSTIMESDAEVTNDYLPRIAADDTQLLQVFQNLIQNAIKFRRSEPPRIHVSAVKNEREWIFSVKDNGIGIDSRHLDLIFVRFHQLHKRGQYEGTGIGLAIVKKIVERHGGRIWAESEPGVGTTFRFTMPEKEIHA